MIFFSKNMIDLSVSLGHKPTPFSIARANVRAPTARDMIEGSTWKCGTCHSAGSDIPRGEFNPSQGGGGVGWISSLRYQLSLRQQRETLLLIKMFPLCHQQQRGVLKRGIRCPHARLSFPDASSATCGKQGSLLLKGLRFRGGAKYRKGTTAPQ